MNGADSFSDWDREITWLKDFKGRLDDVLQIEMVGNRETQELTPPRI